MKENLFINRYQKNLYIIVLSILLLVVGNSLMLVNAEHTPTFFDAAIYSTRVITVAPIVIT